MPVVEQTSELAAPPERVWAVLASIEALPLWLEGVQRVDAITGPAMPGTRFQLRRAGSLHPEQWIVAESEPPLRLRYAEYQRDLQLRLKLAATPAGTRLSMAWEVPRGRGVLERMLYQKTDRRMLERSFERLRALLAVGNIARG